MKATSYEIPHYVPEFIWKLWLSPTGPNNLPRDPRIHIYDVYDNILAEKRSTPFKPRHIFQDFKTCSETRSLVQATNQVFQVLEADAEITVTAIIERAYCGGIPTRSTSFSFGKICLANLCRYFSFLRFRNSAKYREILQFLNKPVGCPEQEWSQPMYQPGFMLHHRRSFLLDMMAFLQRVSPDGGGVYPNNQYRKTSFLSENFRNAMDAYCWRLCDAEISIGIAVDEQEFILTESCFGTLGDGFEENPDCCDLFFPVLPTFALYLLGSNTFPTRPRPGETTKVDVGIESASDVHLRNAMILQTYPQRLYFSGLRPLALSISSYDEFRWIQEHQDYSRLKQRCRQKFLQETVTKTLVLKSSVILTDLTEEVTPVGTCPVGHGAFADVWKAVWDDPVDKRTKNVALKVLRRVMVKNVKEKLMKRLHDEVVAWHRLCHRNINQLFGIVQFQNSIGMVSPWCDNGTLCHYLKGNKDADRLGILVQIASGVTYLHSATPIVIHGDLKGVNILIDTYGCPIITDFGLSKVVEDMSDSIDPRSSFFAGSTRWMAPELIMALIDDEGRVPPITTHSDVYAFASVCLEVATGGLPYPARSNDHAVTVDIIRGVKPSRGAVFLIRMSDEDGFWETLDRCWNDLPYLRPAMHELLSILEGMS